MLPILPLLPMPLMVTIFQCCQCLSSHTSQKSSIKSFTLSLTNSLDWFEFLGGVREQTLASMPIPLAYFFNSNADNGSADWELVRLQTRMKCSCYVHRRTTAPCPESSGSVSAWLDYYTSKTTAIVSVILPWTYKSRPEWAISSLLASPLGKLMSLLPISMLPLLPILWMPMHHSCHHQCYYCQCLQC